MTRRSIIAALTTIAAMLAVAPAALAADRTYVVVYEQGASPASARAAVKAAGGKIVRENRAVGVATVRSSSSNFESRATKAKAIKGVAPNRSIGSVPNGQGRKRDPVEDQADIRSGATSRADVPAPPPGGEPLSGGQWDMAMMDATPTGSYAHQIGSHAVRVGVMDTGIQGNHPDIAPNFNAGLSRNFTTDIPIIDGECAADYPVDPCTDPDDIACADDPDGSCDDPADVDEDGHGTHVAGTIASPLNGVGIGGVAPGVELVNLRAGQDSGYFFIQPTVDALTYAGDNGIDVVNMSFYIDPWLYNCTANPADSPSEQAEQQTIIVATQRALDYARARDVTLVSASGNESTDLGNPLFDDTSPDFPPETAHDRNVDNSCLNLPAEGEGVMAINSVGPTGRKSYFSNYGVEQSTVAAPGGDSREYFGTPQYRRPENLIVAPYPSRALGESHGVIDPATGEPITAPGATAPGLVRVGNDYWQWIQGTSMAAPHAVGVAALIVAQFGTTDAAHGGVTLPASQVERILRSTAVDKPCPEPRLFHYPFDAAGDFDATCEGDAAFNGFYGDGIINALRALQLSAPAPPASAPAPVFRTRVIPQRVTANTKATKVRRGLSLRVSGRLTPAAGMRGEACTAGSFTLVVQTSRRRTVASRETRLRRDCTYSVTLRFASRRWLTRSVRVRVRFDGNDLLLPRRAPLATTRVPR
jgi:subtilisin family serine protease